MSLSKFDVNPLLNVEPFLGSFCFSVFMIFVVFIYIGMFISIINDGFESARRNRKINPEIYSYLLKRFLTWSRLRKPTREELAEERDKLMRSKYVDRIDLLMNKVDQLVEVFDRFISN